MGEPKDVEEVVEAIAGNAADHGSVGRRMCNEAINVDFPLK